MVKKAIAFAMFGGEPKNPGKYFFEKFDLYYSTGTYIDYNSIFVFKNSSFLFSPRLSSRAIRYKRSLLVFMRIRTLTLRFLLDSNM